MTINADTLVLPENATATLIRVAEDEWDLILYGVAEITAAEVSYDNATSGLAATEVQAAIDELAAGSGGGGDILPMVTGEVPPVLLYQEDGSLIYFEV